MPKQGKVNLTPPASEPSAYGGRLRPTVCSFRSGLIVPFLFDQREVQRVAGEHHERRRRLGAKSPALRSPFPPPDPRSNITEVYLFAYSTNRQS
jgi:hypothetical protein